MRRRTLLPLALTLPAARALGADRVAADSAPLWRPLPAVRALRLSQGRFAGGFLTAPGGALNWYFANLGLWPFVGALKAEVRAYLELYLAQCDPASLTIRDVLFSHASGTPVAIGTQASDSDDAYAATLLSLAVRYVQLSGDEAWWRQRVETLKQLALRNLVDTQKPSGLTRVFQDASRSDVAYLMDNCEVWRGLRDLAGALAQRGDAQAVRFRTAADSVRRGVLGLYQPAAGAFLPSDAAPLGAAFYPDGTAQVFAQAWGLVSGGTRADAAWHWLNTRFEGWASGRYDAFPWMVLGYTAAMRGERALAEAQMTTLASRFVSQRGVVTINELGFYQRTLIRLGQGASSALA